ncbi:long-chain fatty acid--CoA ligase [Nocardia beijingensis]|uniref:long-chain-fatty-acid--CoA ligase n=1 Tax=Nocardia beijingensis TaxID=95162 RepID=UPI00344C6938
MVNVAGPMWKNALDRPEAIAIRAQGEEWSYGRLKDSVAAFAGALRAAGIDSRDRVLLVAPSVPEFVVAYLGAHLVGAIVITMNTMATGAEIGYVLDDSTARLAIAWHEATTSAETATRERGLPLWVLEPGAQRDRTEPLSEPVDLAPDDVAVLLYTSGTTGKPKGVELTIANLHAASTILIDYLGVTSEERMGTALPLFHVFGQSVVMNTALHLGASLSLLSRFDPGRMLEMVRADEITLMSGVPTMWNAMLHAGGDFGPEQFGSLRMASSGGASLPAEVIRAFRARFGCEIMEGYGLTESSGIATFNPVGKDPRVGSVGLPLPGMRIEVRDASGSVLGPGEVGELYLSGPTIMRGYWNRPEATASDLRDGWLATGDLGKVDEDGYVYIIDRAKDMIIRGGYNVYPREVEEVLYGHPDIVEAAVIGVPDEHYGEEVAAVIALAPGAEPTPDELRSWAKEQLSAYKVPHLFAFVDQLPKGATGKILKRAIDWKSLPGLNDPADRGAVAHR